MNVSKPVFASVILLGLVGGLMVSQVFNVMAVGGHYRGNPLHEIWEAITELQSRVSDLEAEADNVSSKKFVEPSEFTEDANIDTRIATFTLTPNNHANNAILNFNYYFEYKALPYEDPNITRVTIHVNIFIRPATEDPRGTTQVGPLNMGPFEEPTDYEWTRVGGMCSQLPHPNQPFYTIEFWLRGHGGKAFVRNISLIATIADGIPPTE